MKIIPGYSKYKATRDGRVRTNRLRKGWLTPTVDKNGYIRYYLIGDDGKRKGMYIHQIVARTYIPNTENKPQVNHIDGNKANNSIGNLEWCTHRENILHDWKMGRRKGLEGESGSGSKKTVAEVEKIRQMYKYGSTQVELGKIFDISQPTISQIVRKVTWRNVA